MYLIPDNFLTEIPFFSFFFFDRLKRFHASGQSNLDNAKAPLSYRSTSAFVPSG
jgi:hypothetical protein